MAGHSLPPAIADRIRALETQLENLSRAQNPVKPNLFDIADVSGMPASTGQTLEYNRSTGQWEPAVGWAPGDVKWSASPNAAAGRWLLSNGAAVSRTTYADLFAAIGTTHGAGDGSTTFNLPNLQSRMPIGVGTDALGATGGARTHTLATSETPAHTHTGPSHVHGQLVTDGTGGSATRNDYNADGAGNAYPQGVNTDAAGTGATGSTGGGGSHNNLPPYIALWGLIRY